MKHRRIWFVMLGIIAVGVLVTTCNSFILNKKSATARAPREMAMAETTAGAQFEAAGGGDTGEAETKADSANAVQARFRKRDVEAHFRWSTNGGNICD
ncbi:MAG: hypothetical protein ACLTC4_19425 [Hungatella hathewayi]